MMQPYDTDNNNLGMLVHRPGGLLDHPNAERLTKQLVKVTVQGSVGSVQLVMSPENTVQDLIKAVLDVYDREKRRPLMDGTHPSCFELHYSPFSLECLDPEEKLKNLGSRNFFMCRKPCSKRNVVTWSEQMKNTAISSFPLTKLMDILL